MDSRKIGLFQRTLVLPQLPVSFDTKTDLLGIAYEVRIEVKVGGLNKNPVVRIPISVGNVSTEPNAPSASPSIYPTLGHHQSFSSGSAILDTSLWNVSQQMDISATSDVSNPSVNLSSDATSVNASAPPPSYDAAMSTSMTFSETQKQEISQKS